MSRMFIGALLISIWCVILFWGKSIGLSMLLAMIPFLYLLISVLEKKNKIKYKSAKVLIIPIILLSSTYFIFNNKFFYTINILVIPFLILLMIIEFFEKSLNIKIFISKCIELVFESLGYMDLTLEKIRECIKLKFKINDNKDNNKSAIFKGILITIPIVVVVIVLLSSADEIFMNIFVEIFKTCTQMFTKLKITELIGKIIVIGLIFIYLSCFLDNIVSRYETEENENVKVLKDNTTMKMILSVLNIIYILFCIIQIKSLFMKNTNINYSRYARKGFFELMIVSFINLMVIVIAKKNEKNKFNKYINIMCLIMVICTFIILISAGYRMYLYESAYGYTLLRLLVYVSLFTETILLIPTIIYILDKPINLTKSYFTIIIAIYVILNFVNVDNIIAKENIDRYFKIGKIDLYYLENNISTDAIKQIIRLRDFETENEDEISVKAEIAQYIFEKYIILSEESMDFRDLNLSKLLAKKALK